MRAGGKAANAPARVVVRPTRGIGSLQLGDTWHRRELLYFLVWRDLKVRYKQTLLGVAWVVLQPIAATAIFTLAFGRLARIPTGELPCPMFLFARLLPWNYFAHALNQAGWSSSVRPSAPLPTTSSYV